MLIRQACLEDAPVIADFNLRMAQETENVRLDPAVLGQGVRALLADPAKGVYFVAQIDRRVVGQLMITHEWSDWRNGDIWWIQSVYVHPDYRRRGVFRALFRHAETAAKAAGALGLRLYVHHGNDTAQRTYHRLGMCRSGYIVMEEAHLQPPSAE